MSRVYNVLTGAARPAGPPMAVAVPDDEVWENSEETPFIEIGGPSGPVFFSPPSAAVPASIPPAATVAPATPKPAPERKPELAAEPARPFPRLAPVATPAYLSVRFHEVARGERHSAGGPDP